MAHKNSSNYSPLKARGRSTHRSSRGHLKPEQVYDFPEADDRLADIFRNREFGDYPHDQRKQLVRFYQLLMESQKAQNFTRLLGFRDIAIKHFIDSLMVARLTPLKFPLMDVGTGPGFPGIPLKIHFPKERILLAEGVQKRVEFLKTAREQLKLEQLDIFGRNISEEFVYPVQGVITRAVEDVGNTLRNVSQCLQVGGRVYLMKGPNVDPEIQAAKKDWSSYYKLVDNIAYELPKTSHQRRLVIYEKIATPEYIPKEEEWDDED